MDVTRKARPPVTQQPFAPHVTTQAPVKATTTTPRQETTTPAADTRVGQGSPDAARAYAGTVTTSQTQASPTPGSKNLFLRFENNAAASTALKNLGNALKEIAAQQTVPPPPGSQLVSFQKGQGALIGLPGNQVPGYTDGKLAGSFDANAIPRQPNLTAQERTWETQFAQKFASQPQATVAEFNAYVGDSHIYEVDLAKRCFPEWGKESKPGTDGEKRIRAEGNTALHATAVAITKAAFLQRLDQVALLPKDAPERQVLVTSGGCAAGKGSLTDMLKVKSPDVKFAATWDAAGEGDALENKWILQEAVKRGIPVMFGYVHNEPMDRFGDVLDRAAAQGRMVDVMTFTHSYVEGSRNMRELVASPEFKAAREQNLVSAFALSAGKFNVASLKDKSLPPYPDLKVLDVKDGIPQIPSVPEPGRIMNRALDLLDEANTAGKLPPHLVAGSLSGMARRWPDLAQQYLPSLKGVMEGVQP